MSFEKEQFFCDKKQIRFLNHNAMRNCSTGSTLEKEPVNDPLSMRIQPTILDVSLAYGLKNVKIELPKVNIPNEVLMKHEVDRFRELFQCKQQTTRKSLSLGKINGSNPDCSEGSHLQNKPEVQFEKELKMAAKIVNFTCTKCKDNIRYSPNDLQKHFQLLHYGELPLYPCEMCSFSANDFQSFKQHRRVHRSTLVKCELCNDEQIYTLLDLTKHFISKHCVNGHFQCEKCAFSTHDVGTFVQHIHRHKEIPHKCGKCHQENFTEEELQNHHLVHTSMFSFGCHYCSYSTSRKDYLLKHIIALHKDHFIAKEKLEKDKYEKRIVKTPAGLKLVLKRYKIGASKKAFWRRKEISSGSDNTGEENAQVLRSVNKIQTNAEELNQCMRDVEANEEKDQVKYTEKHNFMDGMFSAATAQYNKADDGTSYSLGLLKNAVHGPTVLMVKNNKICVPANYSAKFMGFKMVDGKQHIVIKLLPTSKQNEYFLGQEADPIKDGSAAPLLQTSDPCGLSSGAIAHITDQSTLKNNSVHPLTSPPFSCPARHSGKIKVEKQSNSILYGRSVSETVAPSNIAVGKSSNYLPMKLGSTVPPCDKVTKVGTENCVSWGNFSPSSHPQVLPPAMTNTLHYDPMKMPFFPELKMQNGGLNNSNGTNNLYYSTSVGSCNEKLMSFHNYSKVDSLDNPCSIWRSTGGRQKKFAASKRISFQNSGSESASSYSELTKGLKAKEVVSPPSKISKTYKHIHTKNSSVSFKSQSKCGVDSECFMENQHHGQQYLDTNTGQDFQNVGEKFQENASDCVNSVLMPKITSVFSLQSEQAVNYLSPEIKQILQDVLKVKTASQQEFHSKTNNCVKLHSDKLLSGHETRNTAFMHLKNSATACGFQRPPSNVEYKRELNTRCSTNEGTQHGREKQTSRTSFDSQGVDKLPITRGAGTLLKTCTDSVIAQQLVKEKILSAAQNPSSCSPVLPVLQEQKKTLFFKSLPSGFFVPLHLANQPGQQVASGKSLPSTSSSDGHVTKGVPASFVSSKESGMLWTASRAVGTVTSAANDSSQVLGGIASREFGKITISTSNVKGENDSFGNVRNSCDGEACSTANESLNSMPFRGSPVATNALESSVKVMSEHQDAVFGSLESVNQQEIKQEQDVYALSPDGQQGAFLKCMTPNKPVVHKPFFFQDNAHYENGQPKKTGAMQQQLLLKMKPPTSHTLADTTQSVRNSVPSLQVDNLQFLTPALAQKQTNLSFNDALILPGGLMPANASLVSSNPACCIPPVEPVYSTKSAGTRLQKGSIESTQVVTANSRNNFGCQKSTWSTQNRTAKVKPRLKQRGSKSSETRGVQRNKNFKRKRKASCPEPPRKKVMLHRKCKEKNQAAVVSESGSPYKQRASKKTVRTLKLIPFNSNQLVKCPLRNQPVVVLNHPDVDVPEVVNVMKTIAKFKGHVLKVSLSKRTIEALLQPVFCSPLDVTTDGFSQKRYRSIKPISPVKERFVLKLTLKKTSKNNYQIVKTTSNNTLKAKFSCWFCGRIFDNQDNWVGHGQRHLMEATRDWNSLM
ncbi:Z518A protein, partial [Mionectes macconnelli]|nr:Z518A protein [Mionectes macconnelli]